PWIGAMAALYAASSFVSQWVFGRLSDVLGRRALLLFGSLSTAVATGLFVLKVPPGAYLAFRALQGVGAGAFIPAANALVGDLVPDQRRGSAFGLLSSASMGGFALGPFIGGIMGNFFGLRAPFGLGAILAFLATVAVFQGMPPIGRQHRTRPETNRKIGHLGRPLWTLYLINFGWTGLVGMYDTVWSLYMKSLGASNLVIGLSFTLFAIPLLLSNFLGGALANRPGWRRKLIIGGSVLNAITVILYIMSQNAWLSIGISVLEAIAMSFIGPALQASLLSQTPDAWRGTIQGRFQAVGTLGALVMATSSGILMTHNIKTPFWAGATLLVVTTAIFAWARGSRFDKSI
ncbi:MAG: MFS transporter, partial [Firmicutes bacterium]|nr:MFS transporter [Bacillota bacterium]